MIKVYVAGDYSANNTIQTLINIGRGQKVCSDLFLKGFAPYDPWADKEYILQNPDAIFDIRQFYKASIAWLEVSDCMYVISGKGNGGGVDAEIKRAKKLNIPVFFNLAALINWKEWKEI